MTKRVIALDALRGLAVAGMILANSPGSWIHLYEQLDHAAWNGFTATDMVFPTFLFSVGVAVGLSFPRALSETDRARSWSRLVRRTLALIGLGLALNLLGSLSVTEWRLPGILQRIGLCYAIGAGLVLLSARRRDDGLATISVATIGGAIVVLLMVYWALLTFVPVPGFGPGRLDPAGNLTAFIDRAIFTTRHLWSLGTDADGTVVYDPEGLLSTLPATANVLIGVLAGWAWKQAPTLRGMLVLAVAGALLVVGGLAFDPLVPINKRIWTSSFALLSSGVSMILFALLALALRSHAARIAAYPLRVLGGNATLAFVLSILLGIFSSYPIFRAGTQTPQAWGMALAQTIVADPKIASLLCALAILMLILALLWPLHRRAIHFRL
ncbi:acyltransferase family protein [Sphingomonas sp. ASY06-1R]|uniref:acyltransferase family protein n=1 Tax=Sphingomonas sp. ASY06-1R TaxID=3445771 RepID=UPI003FA30E77